MTRKAKRLLVIALGVAALLIFLLPQAASAEAPATQAAFTQYPHIVDVKFVEQYAVLPASGKAVIVDSRPKARKYDKGHLPTAISIPDRQFDQFTQLLPEDKSTLVMFYCGGLKCPKSHNSAFKAEKLGYTNLKVFATGYPAWIKAGNPGAVSTEYVKKLVDTKGAVIVDARPKARKYDKGHIPTAISIPDRQFDQHIAELPADKATPLVFYCGGMKCPLSDKSARKAMALGYTNVKTYPQGYPAWVKAYGAGESAAAAAPVANAGSALEAGKEEGTITIASFERILKDEPASILVVDVRSPVEYKAGSFKGAVNIPIDNLEKNVEELAADKPIVFICNSGGLSGEAHDMVKLLRPELTTYFIDAEITFNQDGTYKIVPLVG